eukprot:TRINITY_DN979_c0_g1_i18.p2 TRINITY_DN979_c0_g1~~TRINITY_DN979_c0_g1_i18.p2  ORF type:complete len:132 (-),score=6.10 TRINITY_DN979_c0_g1_i18:65-460(-)
MIFVFDVLFLKYVYFRDVLILVWVIFRINDIMIQRLPEGGVSRGGVFVLQALFFPLEKINSPKKKNFLQYLVCKQLQSFIFLLFLNVFNHKNQKNFCSLRSFKYQFCKRDILSFDSRQNQQNLFIFSELKH